MSGGTFQRGTEKTRPGIYMNFEAAAAARISSAERGTVILPLELSWGEPNTFIVIEREADAMEKLGYDYNSSEMLLVREAHKGAATVLVYRLNTGDKAEVAVGGLKATARYPGKRGNDIKVVISTNILDEETFDVKTYVDNIERDNQTVQSVEELVNNSWIDFSKVDTGNIEITAGSNLSGGQDGEIVNEHYTDFMTGAETQRCETIAFPVDDEMLKTSFTSFIRRLREDEGVKVQGVIPNPNHNSDYEGIIDVQNGVILNDGTVVDVLQATAWVAGATAGASITQSNTYKTYEGAADAYPRMGNSEIINALKAGKYVFVHDGERVKVEQDINSLVTYTQKKNKRFSKNRVIRVLDAINNDIMREFKNSYVGKIDNEPDGHSILGDAIAIYFQTLDDNKAIKNYNRETDIFIDPVNSVGDAVYATLGVQPVDSAEKFYFTVGVR